MEQQSSPLPTAEQYVDDLYAQDEQLEFVLQSIRDNGMPQISVKRGYGRLLTLLVKMTRAGRVLEIGALGGYSGICLARGLAKGGTLMSLELREEYAKLAHENLTKAGFGNTVTYMTGEALPNLEKLYAHNERFDFFFIDADKGNYPNYLEWAIKLGTPGAIIIGDNTLLHNKVMDPAEQGNNVRRMREFNRMMAEDPRLESVMLTAYDGLTIARIV
ncbi:O-methyltransferase [Paenibacillus chartarius]|uniref:O-methyltransferase n=1 Tax=Paenibacillus chartarius TaxID=747481 RepID=A0ABV6DIA5_9BACL